VLRFVEEFRDLTMWELRNLAVDGVPQRFLHGETIVSQDDFGDSMFVVLRGCVSLR